MVTDEMLRSAMLAHNSGDMDWDSQDEELMRLAIDAALSASPAPVASGDRKRLIDRFENAVRAYGYRTCDDNTEREYLEARYAIAAALTAAPTPPAPALIFADKHNDETGECEAVTVEPAMVNRIRERMAAQPAAEPVAWYLVKWGDDENKTDVKWGAPSTAEIEYAEHHGHDVEFLYAAPAHVAAEAQCCMCGKKGLSTVEGDGATECELTDGRWVCSGECWDKAVDPVSAAEAQVRVKPLEWHIGPVGSETFRAKTPWNKYIVWEIGGRGYWTPNGLPGIFADGDLEAAKAAAQADYDQRIRSALASETEGGCNGL